MGCSSTFTSSRPSFTPHKTPSRFRPMILRTGKVSPKNPPPESSVKLCTQNHCKFGRLCHSEDFRLGLGTRFFRRLFIAATLLVANGFASRPSAAKSPRSSTHIAAIRGVLELRLSRLSLREPHFAHLSPSSAPGQQTLHYASEPSSKVQPVPKPGLRPQERFFPRWLAICGISAGSASVVGGSVLLGLNDKKAPPSKDNRKGVYRNRHQGTALLVAGIQTLLSSAVFLIVDDWLEGRFRR